MVNVPKRIATNSQRFLQFWNNSSVACCKFTLSPYLFSSQFWHFLDHSFTDPTKWCCEKTELEVRRLKFIFKIT